MMKSANSHITKAFLLMCLVFAFMNLSVFAQEDNLLTNPGFEDPYITVPGDPDMLVADGWTPWHNPREEDMETFRNAQPQFRGTSPDATRIRTGENAQVLFSKFLTHDGGIFQSVSGISPNVEYLFSVYAYVWSNDFDDEESRQLSANPGGITVQVGIDPLGGTDPNSNNIVWSIPVEQYDAYRQYSISARAASEFVTVWVRTQISFPQGNNFIYLDDASLTVSLDQGIVTDVPPVTDEVPLATNTPAPTNTEATVGDPTPTPEGATNTPIPIPTNTDVPTNTPAPTNTDVPTNTPQPAIPTNTALPSNTPLPTNTPITGDPTPTPEGVIPPTNTSQPIVPTNTPQPEVPTNTPQPVAPTNTPDQVVLETSTPRPVGTRAPIGGAFSADFPNTLLHIVRRGDTVGRLAVLYGSSIEAIAAANGLDDRFLIYVGEELSIPVRIPPPATTTPTATFTPTVTPTATATTEIGIIPVDQAPSTPTSTYTVQRGDTLGRIATRFNTTVEAFAQINGITNPNRIFVGQVLIIPPTGGAISQPNTVIVVVVTATPQPPAPAPQPPVANRTYTVTYGDSLYRIAVRFNLTVADLLAVNPNITNRNLIYVGQVINLP